MHKKRKCFKHFPIILFHGFFNGMSVVDDDTDDADHHCDNKDQSGYNVTLLPRRVSRIGGGDDRRNAGKERDQYPRLNIHLRQPYGIGK